jgi:mRNA interferase YafQ
MEKRNLDITRLDDCIRMLAQGVKLPPHFENHRLSGNWAGYQECHIQPDWLLIYRVDPSKSILLLVRTGTHSDLF